MSACVFRYNLLHKTIKLSEMCSVLPKHKLVVATCQLQTIIITSIIILW